jgi:hypothetical protein
VGRRAGIAWRVWEIVWDRLHRRYFFDDRDEPLSYRIAFLGIVADGFLTW